MLAPGMKTIEDALTIRRRVFGAFEMAESATSRGGEHALAHVRPGRRRPDRGGAGRPDPRGGDQDAARRVPAHRPAGRPGAAGGRGPGPAGLVRPRAVRQGGGRAAQAGRRAAHGIHRDQGRPVRGGGARHGRQDHPARRGHRAVDGRGGGAAAGRDGGRGDRGEPGPVRPDPGQPGPDHSRPPGDHRGRRHDEPATGCPGWPRWPCRPGCTRRGGSSAALAGQPQDKPFRYHDLGLGRLHLARLRGDVGREGCTCPASSAGGAGCSSTSRS